MSYTGTFNITDDGMVFHVAVPNDQGTRTSLMVVFSFEQLQKAESPRLLVHGIIARRVVDTIRSLDEED